MLTVADALTYYPFRVTDPVPVRALAEVCFGEKMACAVDVRALRVTPMNARRGYRLEVLVDDAPTAASRAMQPRAAALVFFSHRKSYVDWMASRLRAGLQLVISGDPSTFNDRLQFTHPDILTVAPAEPPAAEPQLAFGEPAVQPQPRLRYDVDSVAQGLARATRPRPVYHANSEPQLAFGEPAVQPQPRLRYDVDSVAQGLARATRPRPVYHANSRISSEHIHETIDQVLRLLAGEDPFAASPVTADSAQFGEQFALGEAARARLAEQIPDVLPESVRTAKRLMHRAQAFCAIHEPQSVADFKRAIETMRYEEAFVCQCALLMARGRAATSHAYACTDVQLRDGYIERLPFALTNGQREVIDAIGTDMSRAHPMQRLLQGEVGSGKTVVAVAAMLQAVGSGHQAVLVAPTQVLAEQHFQSISASVGDLVPVHLLTGGMKLAARRKGSGHQAVLVAPTQVLAEQHFQSISASVGDLVPVHLLTGGMKLAARRKVLAAAASGEPCIVVATHAAFSKSFQAPNLALAVIDEQHRFGVEQREALRARNSISNRSAPRWAISCLCTCSPAA